ncbi:hypothetical protein TcasGA2_TC000695 [Tribolium castaneum]|uniref:Uncharacterized protein n=1 Tax=Tribolium castaneum TaxID=7070 RepID=D6W8V1_TRICA|nr:hypothetical protein TcasGA2_TC000695 [Tribolium castaneum]
MQSRMLVRNADVTSPETDCKTAATCFAQPDFALSCNANYGRKTYHEKMGSIGRSRRSSPTGPISHGNDECRRLPAGALSCRARLTYVCGRFGRHDSQPQVPRRLAVDLRHFPVEIVRLLSEHRANESTAKRRSRGGLMGQEGRRGNKFLPKNYRLATCEI